MTPRFFPYLLMLVLLVIHSLFESVLAHYRRSGSGFQNKDQGSLRKLKAFIANSIAFSLMAMVVFPQVRLPAPLPLQIIGVALFFIGLAWRWITVVYLGRLFTVDVAIAENHELVEQGPYRFIRHPSYTGLLMIWLGMGLCSGNILTLAILVLPSGWALFHRIRIEEAVLSETFGERYAAYANRTWRLFPFLY